MFPVKFLLITFVFVFSTSFSILVNKYVLWSLHFTYPTVFQSIQMLTVVFIMFSLHIIGFIQLHYLKMDLIAWFPAVLSFSVSIYFGSKALAILPVPVFTLLQQVLTHSTLLIMRWTVADQPIGVTVVLSMIGCWFCVVSLLFYGISIFSCKWLLIHCIANAVYSGYAQYVNKVVISELDKMYMNAFLSVVMLTIFGLETGESWLILEFEHLAKIKFHLACLTSGVLGAVSLLSYTKLCDYVTAEGARLYYTYSMALSSVLSYIMLHQFTLSRYHGTNVIGLLVLIFQCTVCYGKAAVTLTPHVDDDKEVHV